MKGTKTLVKICKGVAGIGLTKGAVGGIFRLYRFHKHGSFDENSNLGYIDTHAKAFFSGVADYTIGIDVSEFYGDFVRQKKARQEARIQEYQEQKKQNSSKA